MGKKKLVSVGIRTVLSVGTELPNVTLSIIKNGNSLALRNARNYTMNMRKVCVYVNGKVSKYSKKYVGCIIKLLLDCQLQVLNCKSSSLFKSRICLQSYFKSSNFRLSFSVTFYILSYLGDTLVTDLSVRLQRGM